MKIALTGGAGFIGSCLLNKLNRSGLDDIIVIDRLDESLKWKNLLGKHFSDYIDKDEFIKLIREETPLGLDMIIHIGACSSTVLKDARYYLENNFAYSRKLAEYCLKKNIKLLYASSAATYGDGNQGFSDRDKETLKLKPLNIYGFSKHFFDLWILKNKLQNKFTGFKFFNVYGPNEYHKGDMRSLICKKFRSVLKEKKICLFRSYKDAFGHGEQKRDFIYVKDAVNVVYHFVEHPDKGGIYNVGTGKAQSWNELARALFSALSLPPRIEYTDMPESLKDKYQYYTQADIAKLRSSGYKKEFYTLDSAIRDYTAYLLADDYI